MSWKPEVDQIDARRAAARELGGAEAIAKQHARGRLTVRERIGLLADPDSFFEQGPIAGHAETDEGPRSSRLSISGCFAAAAMPRTRCGPRRSGRHWPSSCGSRSRLFRAS